jgi:hypothetical protein
MYEFVHGFELCAERAESLQTLRGKIEHAKEASSVGRVARRPSVLSCSSVTPKALPNKGAVRDHQLWSDGDETAE